MDQRTQIDFRALVDQERQEMTDQGYSPRDVLLWLAGARWAARVQLAEQESAELRESA